MVFNTIALASLREYKYTVLSLNLECTGNIAESQGDVMNKCIL